MKQHITAEQIKEIPDYVIMRIFSDENFEVEACIQLRDEHYSIFSKWMTIGKMMNMLEGSSAGRLVLAGVLTRYSHTLITGAQFELCNELWQILRATL